MSKTTKLIFWLWLAITLLFVARGHAQIAGTVNVVFNLQSFIGTPQAVQRLWMTPIPSFPPGVGMLGSNILVPSKITVPTGLNGTVTVSNVPTGYPYLVQLLNQAQPGEIIGQWTNYIPTNVTGTVNAANYLGTNAGPIFGWVFTPDYVTVAASTNITFITNNGILYISSTGGGGGANVAQGTNTVTTTNAGTVVVSVGPAVITNANVGIVTLLGGLSNAMSYIQSNMVTTAWGQFSTNAHWHWVDEYGTDYQTKTNGTLAIAQTNGNKFLLSNGSITLASNSSFISMSNGSVAVATNVTTPALIVNGSGSAVMQINGTNANTGQVLTAIDGSGHVAFATSGSSSLPFVSSYISTNSTTSGNTNTNAVFMGPIINNSSNQFQFASDGPGGGIQWLTSSSQIYEDGEASAFANALYLFGDGGLVLDGNNGAVTIRSGTTLTLGGNNIYSIAPGGNVTFTTNGTVVTIAATGGGGGGSSVGSLGTNYLTNGVCNVLVSGAYFNNYTNIWVQEVAVNGTNSLLTVTNITNGASFQVQSDNYTDSNPFVWAIFTTNGSGGGGSGGGSNFGAATVTNSFTNGVTVNTGASNGWIWYQGSLAAPTIGLWRTNYTTTSNVNVTNFIVAAANYSLAGGYSMLINTHGECPTNTTPYCGVAGQSFTYNYSGSGTFTYVWQSGGGAASHGGATLTFIPSSGTTMGFYTTGAGTFASPTNMCWMTEVEFSISHQ